MYLIWILSNKLDLNQETCFTINWYSQKILEKNYHEYFIRKYTKNYYKMNIQLFKELSEEHFNESFFKYAPRCFANYPNEFGLEPLL